MLANWITLSRFPLLLVSVPTLYFGPPGVRLAGVLLLFVGLMLDTVDGMVARRTGQTSLAGSVLDIAADRTYELVLWTCFADLRLIPIVIPLIVIARTTLTDAFRSIGVSLGAAPFAQHRTAVARFLVGSTTMRVAYSVGKVTAFCGLALAHALQSLPSASTGRDAGVALLEVMPAVAWLTVALCLCRGIPVIGGGLGRYWYPSRLRAPAPAGP